MKAVLEGKDISRSYRKDSRVIQALHPISFQVEQGEILGIVGESGSGKSTLLKQIAGLEVSDTGELFIDGEKLELTRHFDRRKRYREIQMIFQNAAGSFNPRRKIKDSMRENLRFLSGIKNKEQQDAIMREYMQKVDLKEELLDRYPGNLSGGQCQRAAIARALMVNPKILLCDEITSALDVIVQDKVVDVIIKLAGELHVAVIFVSHDLALVGSLCDRILVMKDGTAVEQGSVEEILSHPKTDYTKLLLDSIL